MAVDPRFISLGAHLDIPNYDRGPNKNGSWILADDTGKAIKRNKKTQRDKIDVRFPTGQHPVAKEWGNQMLMINVWEDN